MKVAPRYKLVTLLGKASRKKWLFFFYFVQMRGWGGEGPAQIFCHIFTNYILGRFGGGGASYKKGFSSAMPIAQSPPQSI